MYPGDPVGLYKYKTEDLLLRTKEQVTEQRLITLEQEVKKAWIGTLSFRASKLIKVWQPITGGQTFCILALTSQQIGKERGSQINNII